MTELYACKYRVCIGSSEENTPVFVPAGTIFVVDGINGNMIALKPAVKTPLVKHDYATMVSPDVLEFAFTKNDTI
jgi:hypothetical protein